MPSHGYTRRRYLQQVGSVACGGVLSTPQNGNLVSDAHAGDDTPRVHSVDSAALVIGDDAPPAEFQAVSPDDEAPLSRHLRETDARFADASTASTGYWAGQERDNPRWVLSSMAWVCEHIPDRAAIETAAKRCHDDLAAGYDDEMPGQIDVRQFRHRETDHGRWQTELVRQPFRDAETSAIPLAGDLLYLQYENNVLLGTVFHGPRQAEKDLEATLRSFAAIQASQLRTQLEGNASTGGGTDE